MAQRKSKQLQTQDRLQLHVSRPPDPVNCLTTQATPIRGGRQITNSFLRCLHAHAGNHVLQSIFTERLIACRQSRNAYGRTKLPASRIYPRSGEGYHDALEPAPIASQRSEKQSDKLHGGCLGRSVLGWMRPFLHRRVSGREPNT